MTCLLMCLLLLQPHDLNFGKTGPNLGTVHDTSFGMSPDGEILVRGVGPQSPYVWVFARDGFLRKRIDLKRDLPSQYDHSWMVAKVLKQKLRGEDDSDHYFVSCLRLGDGNGGLNRRIFAFDKHFQFAGVCQLGDMKKTIDQREKRPEVTGAKNELYIHNYYQHDDMLFVQNLWHDPKTKNWHSRWDKVEITRADDGFRYRMVDEPILLRVYPDTKIDSYLNLEWLSFSKQADQVFTIKEFEPVIERYSFREKNLKNEIGDINLVLDNYYPYWAYNMNKDQFDEYSKEARSKLSTIVGMYPLESGNFLISYVSHFDSDRELLLQIVDPFGEKVGPPESYFNGYLAGVKNGEAYIVAGETNARGKTSWSLEVQAFP